MSKTPQYEARVKAILGGLTPGERVCAMTGEKWMMDDEEISWYRKFNVPPSPFSPKARLWHLAANGWSAYQWWWNKHPETGAPVLSYVHPASGIKVLPDKEWFAKDFSNVFLEPAVEQPFFEQFRTLQVQIPVNATRNVKEPENSIATVSAGDVNSFFVQASRTRDCVYTIDCMDAENCVECSGCESIQECYRVGHSQRMFRCGFANECIDCQSSSFIFDCRNCEFCFGACNQRNKKYLWWNEQLTKEEWEKRIAEITPGNRGWLEAQKERYLKMVGSEAVWPEHFNSQSEGSIGEYLLRCANCRYSFFGLDSQDNYYAFGFYNARNSTFCTSIVGDNNYQSGTNGESSNTKFSNSLVRCDDLEYSFNCYDCTHCFGCVGLRHKKFCILNKQYTEAEYWKKVDEMKCAMLERGEYGKPVPTKYSFSYFPESGPAMYLAAKQEDWDAVGMQKFDASAEGAFGAVREGARPAADVPENIDDLDPAVWSGVPIEDAEEHRPFTLLAPEIAFYKEKRIAPPRTHFISRMRELIWMQNTGLFEKATCSACKKELTVAVNRTFTKRNLHCYECYLKYLSQRG